MQRAMCDVALRGRVSKTRNGRTMEQTDEVVYSCTLVAVFAAAFKLGFDPCALVVQAKLELEGYSKLPQPALTKRVGRVLDDSLRIARTLHVSH